MLVLRSPVVRLLRTAPAQAPWAALSSSLRAPYSTAPTPSDAVPRPPALHRLETQEDMQRARDWINLFERVRPDAWPKNLVETSFARSSGAGGQHVNRTMSKAIIRFPLPSTFFIPPYLVRHLRECPHYVANPPSLLISSSTHRTSHTNLSDCLHKLKSVLLDAARRDLVGETSATQKARVKGLAAKEKAKIVKVKKMRKDVKGGRGKVSCD